jgi:hypothetical protein
MAARLIHPTLLAQIGQMLFHGLDLELEVRQIGFQVGDLLGLGQVLPVEVQTATAVASTIAAFTTAASTGIFIAVAGFVRHSYSFLSKFIPARSGAMPDNRIRVMVIAEVMHQMQTAWITYLSR